ncbi:DENN (AEX-3) domain protein [Heracleum sosnowskyi]|uniref:DENN (AEX-3) domain protein n=1 Tax=Heracleum sosnowskyi TaxID=360622 RepID=A0AAD8I3N5_9APIA|nr:DENN (AEX-3) domain protein [Heracleum sosnowskyi]
MVRSPTIPELPRQKKMYSSLAQYHSKLVGESYLGRKRPVYQCTDIQVAAANSFLAVVRSYLDSLTFILRSDTITNVQSNDDKVSLLLKESFIESFPSRDRPFMKNLFEKALRGMNISLLYRWALNLGTPEGDFMKMPFPDNNFETSETS